MPKKRTRYSSSLEADWVVPTASEEEGLEVVPAPAEKVDFPAASKIPSIHAAGSDSNLHQFQEITPRSETKKASRYKKMLPSNWVDPNSTSNPDPDDANLGSQDPRSETPPDVALYGHGIPGSRPGQSILERSTRPAHHIDTSIPRQGNSGYTPPPPPVVHKSLSHHWERDELRSAVPYHETSPNPMARHRAIEKSLAHQSAVVGRSHSFRGATVSPPVSVGQQSSAMTDSPFYGQDLPAKWPSLSPSYSIV